MSMFYVHIRMCICTQTKGGYWVFSNMALRPLHLYQGLGYSMQSCLTFVQVLQIQTQVLTHVWQVHHQLSHIPRPKLFFFYYPGVTSARTKDGLRIEFGYLAKFGLRIKQAYRQMTSIENLNKPLGQSSQSPNTQTMNQNHNSSLSDLTAQNTNEQEDFSSTASQDGGRQRRQVEATAGWSTSSQQEAPDVG